MLIVLSYYIGIEQHYTYIHLSYGGLVDARISASEKNLPVKKFSAFEDGNVKTHKFYCRKIVLSS